MDREIENYLVGSENETEKRNKSGGLLWNAVKSGR